MSDPITMLCIRDPDGANQYVSDGEINEITIDIGASWTSVGEFGSCLCEEQEEAIEYERYMLGEVAHLDADNPVRVAVYAFFAEARIQGDCGVCQSPRICVNCRRPISGEAVRVSHPTASIPRYRHHPGECEGDR